MVSNSIKKNPYPFTTGTEKVKLEKLRKVIYSFCKLAKVLPILALSG